LVFLILVLVWAVILAPSLVRRVRDRRSEVAVGEFHRHLRVLERTAPAVMPPAFRLQRPVSGGGAERFDLGVAPTLMLLAPGAAPARPGARSGSRGAIRQDSFFAPGACKRRRDVVCTMLCVVVGTGLVGAIPGVRWALYMTGAAALACSLYLVALVRMRRRATERTAKLRYMPEPREEPAVVILRRVAH
jgi:hypothetical protein